MHLTTICRFIAVGDGTNADECLFSSDCDFPYVYREIQQHLEKTALMDSSILRRVAVCRCLIIDDAFFLAPAKFLCLYLMFMHVCKNESPFGGVQVCCLCMLSSANILGVCCGQPSGIVYNLHMWG